MFGKEPKLSKTVDSSRFVELQSSGLDIKTEAEQRIRDIKLQLTIDGIHPWAADDRTQQILAWSSLAYMTDRIAEVMARETVVTDKDGIDSLPRAMNAFVTELSLQSRKLDNFARELQLGQYNPTITAETAEDLTILNQLQPLPEYPVSQLDPNNDYESDRETPYGRDRTIGHVTPDFVAALIVAADEIQGYAYTLSAQLGDPNKTIGEIPQTYSTLRAIIQGDYLDECQKFLDHAKGKLLNSTGHVPDEDLSDAYDAAYHALERSGQAFTALHCPATFGADFILER